MKMSKRRIALEEKFGLKSWKEAIEKIKSLIKQKQCKEAWNLVESLIASRIKANFNEMSEISELWLSIKFEKIKLKKNEVQVVNER